MRQPVVHKSDDRILYQRIKDVALKFGKSARYERWVKARSPGRSWHHVCGSVGGRKSTDYLSVMIDPADHVENQDDMGWLIEQLPAGIENLLRYVEELEGETRLTQHCGG